MAELVGMVPAAAVSVRLHRIDEKGDLIACETVQFQGGGAAVDTLLRRAMISGRVEPGGSIQDHFADLLDIGGSMVETVALDAGSYRALKARWN